MSSDRKIVAVAGATGNLGGMIANALLDKPDVTVRALVRHGSAGKAAALAPREAEIGVG